MTDTDNYDQQSGTDVFQTEEYPPATVPVAVEGIVRVDQMPSRCYFHHMLLKTGDNAVQILGNDPRRKKVIMWGLALGAGVETVVIGEQQSQVQAFQGAHLAVGTVIVRYEIDTREAIWARGCIVNDTTGTFTGFVKSTDDAVLSFIVEQWTN